MTEIFTEEEQYLFDINGYLVLKRVIPDDLLERLQEVIQIRSSALVGQHIHTGFPSFLRNQNSDPSLPMPVDIDSGEMLCWSADMGHLVWNERTDAVLSVILGAEYRLDHSYCIQMSDGHPHAGTQDLHNGGFPFDPITRYEFRDGKFDLGLVVVSYALVDCPEGSGGFCVIPGSHKANRPLPSSWRNLANPVGAVKQVALNAGDAVIFTEALTHGTLRWNMPYERQALLLKYLPGHMQFARGVQTVHSEFEDEPRNRVRAAAADK
jgi:ectoine hydroxylase-related dioxygenase (phytanoyl-CoA dioxygenase family)